MTAGRRSPARRALGRNSWPWIGMPSAAENTTCCGSTRAASGKSAATACGARSRADPPPISTAGRGGLRASLRRNATALPSAVGTGVHSIPAPLVTATGAPPAAGRDLGDADRPGLRLSPRGERDAARLGRCPRERDARAVRGPDRVVVAVKGGIEEAQRLGDDVVDGDEGVIAAVADEGELAAVR